MRTLISFICSICLFFGACQQKKTTPRHNLITNSHSLSIGYYNKTVIRQRKRANANDLHQTIDTSRFKQLSTLSPSDVSLLEQIIQDSTIIFDDSFHQAHCYEPRHCILWEDEQQEIIAYLEICFHCHHARGSFSPNIYSNKQFDQLEAFFRERRILK